MRTFAMTDRNNYSWFWNIEVDGATWTVTAGRQGTLGQKRTRTHDDPEQAQSAADSMIQGKLSKGYVETTPPPPPALIAALESALVAKPDELAAHAAYADLLAEQADPDLAARGEFIQVQLALESDALSAEERKRLMELEEELLFDHLHTWLGGMANDILEALELSEINECEPPCEYHFARGWLDRLLLSDYETSLIVAMAQAPETRLLRQLILERDEHGWLGVGSETSATQVLARSTYLGNVRFLRIGREIEVDHWRHFRGDSSKHCVGLVAALPRIEELDLLVNGYDPAPLFALQNLTTLRVLRLYHLQARHPLEILAANPALTNLTHLLLHPPRCEIEWDTGPFVDLAGVLDLLHSPHLPKLTHLQIRLCDMGNAGVHEIVRSGILKRLRVLDLRHGCITDEGARILASCPDLKRLERLDIDRNAMTAAGVAELRSVGIPVRGDDQQTAEQVAGQWYLYEGDTE